jgi:hypothetical protein
MEQFDIEKWVDQYVGAVRAAFEEPNCCPFLDRGNRKFYIMDRSYGRKSISQILYSTHPPH